MVDLEKLEQRFEKAFIDRIISVVKELSVKDMSYINPHGFRVCISYDKNDEDLVVNISIFGVAGSTSPCFGIVDRLSQLSALNNLAPLLLARFKDNLAGGVLSKNFDITVDPSKIDRKILETLYNDDITDNDLGYSYGYGNSYQDQITFALVLKYKGERSNDDLLADIAIAFEKEEDEEDEEEDDTLYSFK